MATEDRTLWGRTSRAVLTFARRFPRGVSGRTQGAERPESGPKRVARLPGRPSPRDSLVVPHCRWESTGPSEPSADPPFRSYRARPPLTHGPRRCLERPVGNEEPSRLASSVRPVERPDSPQVFLMASVLLGFGDGPDTEEPAPGHAALLADDQCHQQRFAASSVFFLDPLQG